MWNKARIMRTAERTLKRTELYRENCAGSSDPENNFQLDYVLVKGAKSIPDMAVAYAHYLDEIIAFDPFKDGASPKYVLDWAFNLDDDLFMYLEQGYELAGMSLEAHCAVWSEIAEIHGQGGIDHTKGMQQYLNYCKRNGVTLELLRREYQYDGMNVMTLYDKSAIREKTPKSQER